MKCPLSISHSTFMCPFTPTLQSLDKQRGLAGPKYSDAYLLRLFREADKGYTHGVQYEDLLTGEPGA